MAYHAGAELYEDVGDDHRHDRERRAEEMQDDQAACRHDKQRTPYSAIVPALAAEAEDVAQQVSNQWQYPEEWNGSDVLRNFVGYRKKNHDPGRREQDGQNGNTKW